MTRAKEEGAIVSRRDAGLRVALVYPNVYRVGMANLGFQVLYSLLNSWPGFAAERFFLPDEPLKTGALPTLRSEETGRPLSDFPVIAFSLPFENDYPTVPAMLAASRVPPLAMDRGPDDPVVIGGGVSVSMNPEPMARFMDLIFIGEVEDGPSAPARALFEALADFMGAGSAKRADRGDLARALKDLPAVYAPSAYGFAYHEDGAVREIRPETGFPERVKAAKRLSKESAPAVSSLFTPDSEFGDALLIEVNRGCGRRCLFCASGWVLHPVRYTEKARFEQDVLTAVRDGRTVGLVGSDLAGYPELESLLQEIVDRGGTFSLSSIRPEGLTPKVIELLAKTGQKTATLAPEVASRRMKAVIGKEIPSERFLELVELLVAAGTPNIRFYFMTGLPWETREDAEALVDFCLQARKVFVDASRPRGRIGRLSVQVNPFVPKPWTPFQWAAMASQKELDARLRIIRHGLRAQPNLAVRTESARHAVLQGLLSRGDRRIDATIMGLGLPGAQGSAGLRANDERLQFYAHRERGADELFPWDIVDHGAPKATLRERWLKAQAKGQEDPETKD